MPNPAPPPSDDPLALPSELAAAAGIRASTEPQACVATELSPHPDADLPVLHALLLPPATSAEHVPVLGAGGHQGEGGASTSTASPSTKFHTPIFLTQEDKAKPAPLSAKDQLQLRRARNLEVVAAVDRKLRQRAQRTVAAIGRASELNDDGTPVSNNPEPPEGWTRQEHRIAQDARETTKNQPGYLTQMLRVHESYVKAESDRPAAPQLNADIKIYVSNTNTYNYPVVDVTEREK